MARAPRAAFQPWMMAPSTRRPGALRLALGGAASLGAFAGSFVFDVADRQPEQLDHGVVVGEVAAVLDDLAQLVVQRLDRVGGVDDLADLGRERQERDEPLPGVLPGRDRRRVLLAQLGVGEDVQLVSRGVGGRRRCRSAAARRRRPCGRCRTRTASRPGSGAPHRSARWPAARSPRSPRGTRSARRSRRSARPARRGCASSAQHARPRTSRPRLPAPRSPGRA